MVITIGSRSDFVDTAALGQWFQSKKRDLPWRKSKDPYRVWVSEIMCQQTTIKAVIPYFERFMLRFPDVSELAKAELPDVFTLWAGLGYYRRARFLHESAKIIVDTGFPKTFEGLKSLPGIGDYTAAAIASISFSEEAAVIDGNVERVLARFYGVKTDPAKGQAKKTLRQKAWALIKGTVPGEHNQAMMELGSLICRPGALALCESCPVKKGCQALRLGLVDKLPAKAPRKKSKERLDRAMAIWRNGKLLYGKRRATQVWGGLYELPRVQVTGQETPTESLVWAGRDLLGRKAHLLWPEKIASTKHGVMNEKITLEVYAAKINGVVRAKAYDELRWVGIGEIDTLALPSPQKKVAKTVFAFFANQPKSS
jgi:A/G-specific adenine glycosylase